jgi:hypothetical protein
MLKIICMIKNIGAFIIVLFALKSGSAQIAKTTVVEHFTNSNCSICASNNPTFYGVLATQPSVLHIAFHPSSPYASCVFSQANMPQNDARTNYYNIFGGTPKFLVNGSLINVANTNTALTTASAEMSNFSIKTTQEFIGVDSVKVKVILKKVASDTLSTASLFVGVAEDTVNQTTGNGESIHQDVFRKGLTSMTGDVTTLPLNVNDSLIIIYGYKILSSWSSNRMNTIAILQNTTTKQLIQSNQSVNIVSQAPNGVNGIEKTEFLLYPNPSNGIIHIKGWQDYSAASIRTLDGRRVSSQAITSSLLDIQNLNPGVYIIQLQGKEMIRFVKITINKY